MKRNVLTEETTALHNIGTQIRIGEVAGTQIRIGKVAGTGSREQELTEMMSNDGQTISSLK